MRHTNTPATSDCPIQNFSHSIGALNRSTNTASAEFCGFQQLRQSPTPLARFKLDTSSTRIFQLIKYPDSYEEVNQGTTRLLADVAPSKGVERMQKFIYHDSPAPSRETSVGHSRQVSPFTCYPSEDILQVSASSSTPNFGASKDTPQSTRNTKLPHHRAKRPDNTTMSFSRTTSVAGSPSPSTLANCAPPNNRKRSLSPTTPLLPKRVKATGPFADSDDSGDDAFKVAAPPKRPILNLQRLKQAIARNNQDASNARGQATVGKEGVARPEHGANSQTPKKNNGKYQQPRTLIAGVRKAVTAPPNNLAKGRVTSKQEAVLSRAQHAPRPVEATGVPQSKPPRYQAGIKKGSSIPEAPRAGGEIVSKAGNLSGVTKSTAGTAPVANPQTVAHNFSNRPAFMSLAQAQKTPHQTEEVKKTEASVQVARQPKPTKRPATRPSVATAKQPNTLQNHDAKRPCSPTIPALAKKQKTGGVSVTSSVIAPGTSSVNTPTIPKKSLAQISRTLIIPKKTSAAPGKILSPSSPTPLVINKIQSAVPEVSPLVRSATPTLLKQSPIAPSSNQSASQPASTTPCSPTSKVIPVPSKVNPAQKSAKIKSKIALEVQKSAPVRKQAQITPKGNVNTPRADSVAPNTVLASVPVAKAVVPSSKQCTSAQAAPLPPKKANGNPQATPSTKKVVEPAKLAQVPESTPVAPNAAPVTREAVSIIQAGPSSHKMKHVTPKDIKVSKAASIAPQAASVDQKTTQVIPKWSPPKGSPSQAVIKNMILVTTKMPPKPKDAVLIPPKAISTPTKEAQLVGKEIATVHKDAAIALEGSSTPPKSSPVVQEVNLALQRSANEPASSEIMTSQTRKEQPFFEYTVFQKRFPASEIDNSTPSVQIATFTDIDNANAQAEKLHLAAAHQHPLVYDIQYSSWNNKPDAFDCMTYLGTFAPVEYPTHKSYIKIWVERHPASAHTNRQASAKTHFLAKTVFILRLCKVVDPDSDGEAMEDSDSEDEEPMRVFQALPEGHAEIYTTLDAANRAARRLQIEMSHEKEPKHQSKKMWQEKEAKDLYAKVTDLEKNKGYWESRFNEVRLGGDKFELVVEQTRLFGPRNL
jgi:hypothetical protein